jgi:NADH-quinone oxidoreductase subunit M
MLVGYLYERRHSLEIADYGGVATPAPWLSTVFLITTLASIGLPTLNNFVGEFLVLQGSAQVNFRWTVFAALGVILSAVYMLWLYQRVFFGEAGETVRHHAGSCRREWAAILPARADGLDGHADANVPARDQRLNAHARAQQCECRVPGEGANAAGCRAS